MKSSVVLIMLALLLGGELYAQSVQVVYAETRDLTKKAQKIEDPRVLAVLGSLSKNETLYTLEFSEGKSSYSKGEGEGYASGGNATVIQFTEKGYQFYKDQKTKKAVEKNSILNKQFLIEEDLMAFDWKVETDGAEEIAGYKVTKASATSANGEAITAWFTTDVPVNDGPRQYWGLPGLILKVEAADLTIQAKSLTLAKEKRSISVPEEGEVVSRTQFEETKKEKESSFLSGFGGVGNVIKIDD